jgi:hypothetical protein
MKVALCFFGQPRFLNNPYSYISHKIWILDKYETDIYIHSWINKDNKECEYSDWVINRQKLQNIKYETFTEYNGIENDIIKKYKPKKYIFEKSKDLKFSVYDWEKLKEKEKKYYEIWNGDFHLSKNNEKNILSQLYSIDKVLNLLDTDYDWVILSRFDNYIINLENLYNLNNNYLYIKDYHPNNFNDVLMFGGMKFVEPFKLYDKVSELVDDIEVFTPEQFKKVSFYKKYEKEKLKRYQFQVSIIRSNNGEIFQY